MWDTCKHRNETAKIHFSFFILKIKWGFHFARWILYCYQVCYNCLLCNSSFSFFGHCCSYIVLLHAALSVHLPSLIRPCILLPGTLSENNIPSGRVKCKTGGRKQHKNVKILQTMVDTQLRGILLKNKDLNFRTKRLCSANFLCFNAIVCDKIKCGNHF